MPGIERIFEPRLHDLGGFTVGRVLPYVQRRMVGPFIFLDHMGPAHFEPGRAIDVRPHPHIGLSTLTWLFEGTLFHRDNLGNSVEIAPGEVNWMTAGRGIAHSERSSAEARKTSQSLHGLQFWVALPKADEEIAPEFHHYVAAEIPRYEESGLSLTVVAGEVWGVRSPVRAFSPLVFVDGYARDGASIPAPSEYSERALYVIDGEIEIDGQILGPRHMIVLESGAEPRIIARGPAHVIMVGGEPFPEPRHIWWNFVSSTQERIEAAKADWKAGRFAPIPGDGTEFIPLPD